MRNGADVEIEFNGDTPKDWLVDGKKVVNYYRQECMETESGEKVDALFLVTEDGEEYPLWKPIGM